MRTPTMPSTTAGVRTTPTRVPTATASMLASATSMLTTASTANYNYFVIGDKTSKLTIKPQPKTWGFFYSNFLFQQHCAVSISKGLG